MLQIISPCLQGIIFLGQKKQDKIIILLLHLVSILLERIISPIYRLGKSDRQNPISGQDG
jgi:hypothetical protein